MACLDPMTRSSIRLDFDDNSTVFIIQSFSRNFSASVTVTLRELGHTPSFVDRIHTPGAIDASRQISNFDTLRRYLAYLASQRLMALPNHSASASRVAYPDVTCSRSSASSTASSGRWGPGSLAS